MEKGRLENTQSMQQMHEELVAKGGTGITKCILQTHKERGTRRVHLVIDGVEYKARVSNKYTDKVPLDAFISWFTPPDEGELTESGIEITASFMIHPEGVSLFEDGEETVFGAPAKATSKAKLQVVKATAKPDINPFKKG